MISTSVEERFWAKVDKRGPVPAHCPKLGRCWIWTGSIGDVGYGTFGADGRRATARTVRSHRFAWELTHGAIPKGKLIMHRCDNRLCCNPKHLTPGTHTTNFYDSDKKGRSGCGERQPGAKITAKDVVSIRKQIADGRTMLAVGNEYNLCAAQVHRIVHRARWKHVL